MNLSNISISTQIHQFQACSSVYLQSLFPALLHVAILHLYICAWMTMIIVHTALFSDQSRALGYK